MRVGIIGGSIAGCATAALLHRAGHDVIVFERSESDLVSRGGGIAAPTAVWQDMMAHGLIDATLPACRADYFRFVTRGSGTGQQLIPVDGGGAERFISRSTSDGRAPAGHAGFGARRTVPRASRN